MFEYDQEIVRTLLEANPEFEALYRRHCELKTKVHNAESGTASIDDIVLGSLKKKKLLTKDKMAAIIEQYRREHA